MNQTECISINNNANVYFVNVLTKLFIEHVKENYEYDHHDYALCFRVYIPSARQEQIYSVLSSQLESDLLDDFLDKIVDINDAHIYDSDCDDDTYVKSICECIDDNCISLCDNMASVIKEKLKSQEIELKYLEFICCNNNVEINMNYSEPSEDTSTWH